MGSTQQGNPSNTMASAQRNDDALPPHIELDVHYYAEGIGEDTERFQRAARWIASRQRLNRLVVSIAVVDDEASQQWNREHLDHDYPTDVISFMIERGSDWVDGEIIANAEMACRMAPQAGWRSADELLLYVVHGLLHVVGFDDVSPKLALQMRNMERDCLKFLGVPNADAHGQDWGRISY